MDLAPGHHHSTTRHSPIMKILVRVLVAAAVTATLKEAAGNKNWGSVRYGLAGKGVSLPDYLVWRNVMVQSDIQLTHVPASPPIRQLLFSFSPLHFIFPFKFSHRDYFFFSLRVLYLDLLPCAVRATMDGVVAFGAVTGGEEAAKGFPCVMTYPDAPPPSLNTLVAAPDTHAVWIVLRLALQWTFL
ncbi:hypothetical protein E2C01_002625 [Portunus trituberculatus]|uniref:Uncharacterized protein n=1 Tax=Portunus trituberculatus TaxID=210409 RepID=A0A5B7CKU8_PORTR|nr:hypothetical protein [Portunus trituberculatus]